MKRKAIVYEVTAMVRGRGPSWCGTYRVVGLQKLDLMARLEAEGSKVIRIRRSKCII